MLNTIENLPVEKQMVDLYNENLKLIRGEETSVISRLRDKAMDIFRKNGFPGKNTEGWRFTDIMPLFNTQFNFDFNFQSRPVDIEKIFTCDVYDLDTFSVTLLNGWYVYKNVPLTTLSDGTVIGSLSKAMDVFPELVGKYLGTAATLQQPGLTAFNTAFFQDGLFIYVPENTKVEKPIQLINIVNSERPIMLQPRYLLIQEKNSSLTLVHCDHAMTHSVSLTNTVSEVFLEQGAQLDHYKIQNKRSHSAVINNIFFRLKSGSNLTSNTITLYGGFTKNVLSVQLAEPEAKAELNGLYLVDENQHVDNQLQIEHAAPNCISNQQYKGILDDNATAVFTGKIMVNKDAQKTLAYQNNKNILLTDHAKVNAQPQLEIYADDVKCSHGATVGQLDSEALFYMRTRGLSTQTARQLLLLAFAGEIVDKISIDPLRESIARLVEKRLKGELSICDQCLLHCNSTEPTVFNIDMSKI